MSFMKKMDNMNKKKKESITFCRLIKILFHRYLIFSFLTCVFSYELVLSNVHSLGGSRLYCALAALIFIAIVLGRRGALYSYFICIGFLGSLAFYERNGLLTFSPNLYEILIYIGTLISFITALWLVSHKYSEDHNPQNQPNLKTRDDLYAERLSAFDAISEYLENHSVIGIDSPYGNGKSTVVEALRTQKKGWEFITIGILSTTIENVEFCIIRELNRKLESYGIFSNPISKIKSFFSHDFAFCVGDLLFESLSYEAQIKDFVDDIRSLKKTIVLNFEDIDRITDKEHLNKIFSICDSLLKFESMIEALPEKRYIKVIYQCSIDSLKELFEEENRDERYIEKYIPHFISLQELNSGFFRRVIKSNPEKYENISNIEFVFLDSVYRDSYFQEGLQLSLVGHTVRGIEQILDNVNTTFKMYENISVEQEQDVEAVLIFYIIMYFFPNIYRKLRRDVRMDEQRIFNTKLLDEFGRPIAQTPYGFEEIVSFAKLRENWDNNFFLESYSPNAKENRDALLLLFLLGFNPDYYHENSVERERTMQKDKIVNWLLQLH